MKKTGAFLLFLVSFLAFILTWELEAIDHLWGGYSCSGI